MSPIGFIQTWAGLYRALDNVCTPPCSRPRRLFWALKLTWIASRITPASYDRLERRGRIPEGRAP